MVECSPGPDSGVSASAIDNALETDQEHARARVLAAHECKQPPQQQPSAANRSGVTKHASVGVPAPFLRSNSVGTIRASVSPLPANMYQGCIKQPTNREFAKQPHFSDDQEIRQGSEACQAAEESDTFLNASMQLMHLNGEARQRVRQLWTSVQRLGRENQISETGMDLLYVELGNILKGMSAEKLEATKYLKTGRLVLLASSPASDPGTAGGGAAVKALFGSRPVAQMMQCSLSEEQSKFEMTPVRQQATATSSSSGTPPNPPAKGRFALPSTASLMGMISDAFQEEPTTRVIRLQGCQVRRLVPQSPSVEAANSDIPDAAGLERRRPIFHRFQLLVPYKTQMSVPVDGVAADVLFPTRAPVPYESFIFEVPTATPDAEADMDADAQVDDWVWALDRVCRFQLHRLEHVLRDAPSVERYRETLQRHFPVCVSLSWLRNRVEQPTPALQRRASVNLSMIQVVKDLGRDKVMLDDQLFSASNPFEGDDVQADSVSEVVKYMVKRILAFEQEVAAQHRPTGKAPPHQPSSPAHRFAKPSEARALAFVERVLQGTSRTQSGGDIYDAISFFCQQEHVSICPVSQDAHPVQMRLISDAAKGAFQVEVQVCMHFKVIELTPRSPTPAPPDESEAFSDSTATDSARDSLREWAVLEGTLSRQFTLGQLSAPGTVTINYIAPQDK